MVLSRFPRGFHWIASFVIFSLGLAACKPALPVSTPQASITPLVSETLTPTPTTTPEPTATPLPPSLVLLAAEGAEQALAGELQAPLEELAANQGLRFQKLDKLSPTDLQNTRLVVVLAPDPGLAQLASAAPNTQFLAVGLAGIAPAGNLMVTGGEGERPDQAAFLAGYTAALITSDWRVGIISRSDTPDGIAARNGFIQGVIYYCGLCRPAYPPFYSYPLYSEVSGSGGEAEWQAAADALISQAIETVYVAPGAGDAGLLQYLAEAGVNIIGSQPPPAGLSQHWVVTLHTDVAAAALGAAKQLLEDGAPGLQTAPLQVDHINPDLLSPGRLRLVQETRDKLVGDLLDTRVDLQTGELKP